PVSAVLRMIVSEVIPGVAVGAVILAHGAPLPLTQIRSPFLPRGSSFAVFLEPGLFGAGFVGLIRLHGSLFVGMSQATSLSWRDSIASQVRMPGANTPAATSGVALR